MAKASRRDIAQVILKKSQTLSGKKLASEIAAYVIAERRTSELDAILREVNKLRNEQSGIVEATVTSAHPWSATKKEIKKILNHDNLVINEVVDPAVIGGVRVETSEKSLDLTVRNRLNKLKTMSA